MEVQTQAYRDVKEGNLERAFSDIAAVIPNEITLGHIKERLASLPENMNEVTIVNEDSSNMIIELKIEETVYPYEINILPSPEGVHYEQYYRQDHTIAEEVFEHANHGFEIVVRTIFNNDILGSFFQQLHLLWQLAPEMLFALDISASAKVISRNYVQYHIENNLLPDTQDLYVIHSIYEGESEVPSQFWFHTHGLLRAGLTDVELIIPSSLSSYNGISDLFNTFVNNAIQNGSVSVNEPIVIAQSKTGYIQVIAVPWEEGLAYIGKKSLPFDLSDVETEEVRLQPVDAEVSFIGGMQDRDEYHQLPSCLLFEYKEDEGYMQCFTKEFTESEELMFYKTNEETYRIAYNAKQSFGYFAEIFHAQKGTEGFQFIAKFGIPYDEEEFEHMWFDMQEITEETINGILMNSPYYVTNMEEGNQYHLDFEQLTDWIIYAGEDVITPSNLYLFIG
ncbi:DUF4026 domain-containing protein [Heyndrickxia sp. NPDC080065]|uniref:DUF4026 domain-containing protein n=1 Tax=Heyndrickxia sp. NPDC080065 TaxID=3390568 RepID=UPI003D020456